MTKTPSTSPAAERQSSELQYGLIKAHGMAALVTLLISVLFGIVVSIKLHHPDLMGTQAWLTWGRLRYNHTQGIFFGWLGNVFWMFLYYAVPKLALRPVLSKHLGWWLFAIWNFVVVLPGWALVMVGFSQPLEWGEFPLIVDAFVVLSFLISIAQFAVPLLKAKLSLLYVSGWYILGGLVFTLLAYPIGNIIPELVPGAQGAAFSGLWIHDAIGLYVTPLILSIAYFVIPMATRRPIYSHFLSMIGFWLLFFVYPLNGTHHYVFSAIPMDAQKGAIVASVYLGLDVILVVTNLLMSLRGTSKFLKEDVSLRFVWMGVILYLIVSLQGSAQALMPINRLTHFSDWVIGHSHLAMLGFATFIAVGGITHIWQRIPGVHFNAKALTWCYWLMLSGLILMVSILSIAGLVEAHMWQSTLPWIDSVRTARDYWLFRSFTAIPILAGFICLWITLTTGPVVSETEVATAGGFSADQPTFSDALGAPASLPASDHNQPELSDVSKTNPWLNMAYLSASIAGVGFFLFSFGILAVIPGMALEAEITRTKPATMLPPTAQEESGRLVYAREGCAYCHTQQVRVVPADVDRFGAPTRAWETEYDYPHLWGTRRIGPDLARESGIRSDDWQLTHLYNPRMIVADSAMPGYPWLFNGSASRPGKEAADLLAYIKSLGKARLLAGSDPLQWTVPSFCSCPEDIKKLETTPTAVSASPYERRRSHSFVPVELSSDPTQLAADARRGGVIFGQNCATCHGATGDGNGPGAESLLPRPADLTKSHTSVARFGSVFANGVAGTAMPAWRHLPERDVEALIAFMRTLQKPASTADTEAQSEIAEGKQLFQAQCVSCHGTAGNGNGPAAAALDRCPTNFTEKQPTAEYALHVLEQGVPGTAMPPWQNQLSLPERQALTAYVRSLYAGGN